MSQMTSIIITGSCLEKEKDKTQFINRWLKKNDHLPIKEIKESYENKWLGGEKVFTSYLLIGQFNYLDVDKFIKMLNDIRWEYPEMIRILIEDNSRYCDEGYKLFKIKVRKRDEKQKN